MQLLVYVANGRTVCAERWEILFCQLDLSWVYQANISSAIFFFSETNELISKTKQSKTKIVLVSMALASCRYKFGW